MDKVIVTVTGTQQQADGENDRIELVSEGQRQEKQGVSYITYKEELSGMEKTTTLLKLYPDRLVLVRMGAYEQKQEFFPGRKTYSAYITPFGSMNLGVSTREMLVREDRKENGIPIQSISIQYELEIDGHWQSSNTLLITVERVGAQ